MPMKLTRETCQSIIFKLGIKSGISPKVIATKLLSVDDKHDMLAGRLSIEELEAHVIAWKENGLFDYVRLKL